MNPSEWFNGRALLEEVEACGVRLSATQLDALVRMDLVPSVVVDGETRYPLVSIPLAVDAFGLHQPEAIAQARVRAHLARRALMDGASDAAAELTLHLDALRDERQVLGRVADLLPLLAPEVLLTLRGAARLEWRLRQSRIALEALMRAPDDRSGVTTVRDQSVPRPGASTDQGGQHRLATSTASGGHAVAAGREAQLTRPVPPPSTNSTIPLPRPVSGGRPVLASPPASPRVPPTEGARPGAPEGNRVPEPPRIPAPEPVTYGQRFRQQTDPSIRLGIVREAVRTGAQVLFFEELTGAEPDVQHAALMMLARVQEHDLGQPDAAAATLRAALSLDAADAGEIRARIVALLKGAGDLEGSAAALREWVEQTFDETEALPRWMALVTMLAEDLDAADRAADTALEAIARGAFDATLLERAVSLLERQERWGECLDVLREWAGLAKDQTVRVGFWLRMAAMARQHLDAPDHEVELLADGLVACEGAVPLAEALAHSASETGDAAAVAAAADALRAAADDDARRVVADLAARNAERGNRDEAGRWIELALDLVPTSGVGAKLIDGRVRGALGRLERPDLEIRWLKRIAAGAEGPAEAYGAWARILDLQIATEAVDLDVATTIDVALTLAREAQLGVDETRHLHLTALPLKARQRRWDSAAWHAVALEGKFSAGPVAEPVRAVAAKHVRQTLHEAMEQRQRPVEVASVLQNLTTAVEAQADAELHALLGRALLQNSLYHEATSTLEALLRRDPATIAAPLKAQAYSDLATAYQMTNPAS